MKKKLLILLATIATVSSTTVSSATVYHNISESKELERIQQNKEHRESIEETESLIELHFEELEKAKIEEEKRIAEEEARKAFEAREARKVTKYVSSTSGLNVRVEPNTSSKIVNVLTFNSKIVVYKIDNNNDWVEYEWDNIVYYLSAKLLSDEKTVVQVTTTSNTSSSSSKTTSSSYSGNTSDAELLACLLDCEAYNNYEYMLAVATVIMNRVESGKFPNSINGVIYAKGQFSPTWSGKLSSKLESGASSTARKAASDAIAGTRLASVSHCYYFLSAKSTSRSGVNVGGNLFFASW